MKIKVRDIYENSTSQVPLKTGDLFLAADSLCDLDKLTGDAFLISEDKYATQSRMIQRYKYVAELEIESDEPKVYHAANHKEAISLHKKRVQAYDKYSNAWITGILEEILDLRLVPHPFGVVITNGEKKYLNSYPVIREYKPTTKIISIAEAQKICSEQLGGDVRIES